MKHSLSMIYRLGFLVFFIWAFLENGFTFSGVLPGALTDSSIIVGVLCFICILAVFIFSVAGRLPAFLIRVKFIITALAVFILAVNLPIWFLPHKSLWLFKVLLPAIVFLDWLLFDKKGSFKLLDTLFMLLGIAILYLLWSLLNGNPFDLKNLLDFFGGAENLLNTLLFTLGAGGLMFVLDKLFSGKGSKKLWDLFAIIYRILFLVLTGWALIKLSGNSLHNLLFDLNRYEVLYAFLSFLCILLVLIICLIKYRSLSSKTPFARVKGAFTASAVIILVWRFVLFGESVSPNTITLILTLICPVMMFFDWVLFDTKGKFHLIDPLWWSIVPIGYAVILYFTNTLFPLYPSFLSFKTETFFMIVLLGVPAIGYLVFLLDLCFKRR